LNVTLEKNIYPKLYAFYNINETLMLLFLLYP